MNNVRNNITVTPQGMIYLCKCPLENDYKNQLTFANATAQATYFNSIIYKTCSDYTYIKKDNAINVAYNIDEIITCNYLFYQNVGFTNKTYYCFITNMEYVNENCTRITIETDCFQTYQFNLTYNTCFVEREHVNDDTLGLNTVPENLETGEYIINSHLNDAYNNQICAILGSSEDYLDSYSTKINLYNNIPAPVTLYRYDSGADLASAITTFNSAGKQDAIQSLYIAPKWIAPFKTGETIRVATGSSPVTQDLGVSRISTLNGYTPKNNKMLCWPYCYIGMSNGVGQYNIYHQENWTLSNNEMKIRMFGCLTSGTSIKAVPLNYLGNGVAWDDAISIGKYPPLAWQNDSYTNWLTQNGVNAFGITLNATEAGYIGGMAKGLTGALIGDYGMVGGGARDVWDTMQADYRHDVVPVGVRGSVNSGDVMISAGANTLHVYRVTIKYEYAKIIDDYLSCYGYKVNKVKIPNITGRTNWNYVKTVNCNVEADIPETDLAIIRQMFNNGVTLWHNPSTIYNYSNSNTIVS